MLCLDLSHKHTLVQRLLCTRQEFGKSKIYLPLQEDVEVLNKEVCSVNVEHFSLHQPQHTPLFK